jgi:hypothetical protein
MSSGIPTTKRITYYKATNNPDFKIDLQKEPNIFKSILSKKLNPPQSNISRERTVTIKCNGGLEGSCR